MAVVKIDKRKSRTPEQKAATVAKRKATIAAKEAVSTEVEKSPVAENTAKLAAKPTEVKPEQPAQLPKQLQDRIESLGSRTEDARFLPPADLVDDHLGHVRPGPTQDEVSWFVERDKATASMKSDVARFNEWACLIRSCTPIWRPSWRTMIQVNYRGQA